MKIFFLQILLLIFDVFFLYFEKFQLSLQFLMNEKYSYGKTDVANRSVAKKRPSEPDYNLQVSRIHFQEGKTQKRNHVHVYLDVVNVHRNIACNFTRTCLSTQYAPVCKVRFVEN